MAIQSIFKSNNGKFDIKLEYSGNESSIIYITENDYSSVFDIATAIYEIFNEKGLKFAEFPEKITCEICNRGHGENHSIEISKKDCFEDVLAEVAKEVHI